MSDILKVFHPKLYSNFMTAPSFLVFLALLQSKSMGQYARTNLVAQLAVFIPCVQIPALRTGRLSYVDLAWPTGLLAMGLHSFARAVYELVKGSKEEEDDRDSSITGRAMNHVRRFLIAFAYIFQGGRMALGAWTMFSQGHLRKEMQRYKYQRQRWAAVGIKAGTLAETIEIQKEAFTQCVSNLGTLSVPLALQSCTKVGSVQLIEVVGWLLWGSAFVWEHTSDLQKLAFGIAMKRKGLRGKVCDWGFWNYTRHPNYFGEWMVWVALTLATVPALRRYVEKEGKKDGALTRHGVAIGLLSVPVAMYVCLVHWTGAVPAEFYSVKNRPDYARYLREVNCFFPGPRRAGA